MNTSEIKHISDFSDKLNPMLVKELRQGLRRSGFVILFISLQAILAFILLFTAGFASSENAGHLLSRTFFFLFSCAALIVQPLRGISALSSEIKADTIDLLCLTRLSTWRIAFGKWISLVGQSALILTAIIPYLIFRYFFGDMQIFSEIMLLFSIFIASATLTACTVGLSSTKSSIVRVLLPLGGSMFTFIIISRMFASSRYLYQDTLQLFDFVTGTSQLNYIAFLVVCLYIGWMCLDFACSQVAPIAESRSTLKRTMSFVMIALALITMTLAEMDFSAVILLSTLLCLPISVISLTEKPQLVPPIVEPFVKKGILGKIAGRFLYPGWATGLLYTLLLFILLIFALLLGIPSYLDLANYTIDEWAKITALALFASLFFPIAMTGIFARKRDNRFGLFMLFSCIQLFIICSCYACEQLTDDLELMPYFCWIPLTLPILESDAHFSSSTLNTIAWLNVGVYFLIALATTSAVWKHIRSTEAQLQPSTES